MSALFGGVSALFGGVSALFGGVSALFGGVSALFGGVSALFGGVSALFGGEFALFGGEFALFGGEFALFGVAVQDTCLAYGKCLLQEELCERSTNYRSPTNTFLCAPPSSALHSITRVWHCAFEHVGLSVHGAVSAVLSV